MDSSLTDSMLRGRSERLRTFIEGAPLVRRAILAFLTVQARRLPSGSRVLDVGAGDAPYRELFAHTEYVTLDHPGTIYTGRVDLIADATAIPVEDGSFDAVVCTEVLEHVPRPLAVLIEFRRVLRAGGTLIATVPFAWPEHEAPHDYFRYTRFGMRVLLEDAGFAQISVEPRSDSFTTLAQLVRELAWVAGESSDGMDALRHEARETLSELAEALLKLAPLDVEHRLPSGLIVSAIAGQAP